jgi:hypothetical protein
MTDYTSAIKDAPPGRAKVYFLQVLGIGDAHQNKRGLLTCCGDLLLKRFQQTSDMHDITNTIFAYELAFKLVPSSDPEYLIYMQDIAISYMLRYRLPVPVVLPTWAKRSLDTKLLLMGCPTLTEVCRSG